MVPELATLELLFADFYRTAGDYERVAAQAGLDPSKIAVGSASPATAWHMIVTAALQDERLPDLYAIVRKEHSRNGDLRTAWDAYQLATAKPVRRSTGRSPRAQAGAAVSDYRSDERREARVDQMQRDIVDLRVMVASLSEKMAGLTKDMSALAKQNELLAADLASLGKQNESILKALDDRNNSRIELPHSLQWYVTAFIVIAVTVYLTVYFGGNK